MVVLLLTYHGQSDRSKDEAVKVLMVVLLQTYHGQSDRSKNEAVKVLIVILLLTYHGQSDRSKDVAFMVSAAGDLHSDVTVPLWSVQFLWPVLVHFGLAIRQCVFTIFI